MPDSEVKEALRAVIEEEQRRLSCGCDAGVMIMAPTDLGFGGNRYMKVLKCMECGKTEVLVNQAQQALDRALGERALR